MTLAKKSKKSSKCSSPYQTVSSNKIKVVIFYYYNKQNAYFQKLPIGTYFYAIQ